MSIVSTIFFLTLIYHLLILKKYFKMVKRYNVTNDIKKIQNICLTLFTVIIFRLRMNTIGFIILKNKR